MQPLGYDLSHCKWCQCYPCLDLDTFFVPIVHPPPDRERVTRQQYYLQLRDNLLHHSQLVSEEKCFMLASYALQVDHGNRGSHCPSPGGAMPECYFDAREYFPAWVSVCFWKKLASGNVGILAAFWYLKNLKMFLLKQEVWHCLVLPPVGFGGAWPGLHRAPPASHALWDVRYVAPGGHDAFHQRRFAAPSCA